MDTQIHKYSINTSVRKEKEITRFENPYDLQWP
jgi:hypothetical protein